MKNPWKRLSKINPQKEDGHRRISTCVLEALVRAKLTTTEMSIILTVISKTWGFNKKFDAISISQLSEATGFTSRAIQKSNKSLIKKRVLVVESSKRVNRGSPLNAYMLNKHYDTWKIQDRIRVNNSSGGEQTGKKRVNNRTPTIDINTIDIYSDKQKKFVRGFNSYILEKHPRQAPTNKTTWESNSLETIRKLIRIDGFEENYVYEVIRWAKKDEFWCGQLYSLAGLRKKNGGRTKFQKIMASHDKEHPEVKKGKIKYAGVYS